LSLRRPQDLPFWLKEKFSPYSHAYFSENLANQIKARFFYQTRNYPPLLAYISDMKRRESIIYGRVEMLAMEACAFYQMKERAAALDALRAAYIAASSNGIIAPFAELGKDMRTLAQAALGDGLEGVPADWLETVRRLSASFAKYQSLMISEYEKEQGQKPKVSLSERERGILRDLYIGLSRAEIAVKESLSVNTVNSAVNSIFSKLGARGIVDAVRIAAEEKLVPPSK
jgi:LuxR family maltose regulon positive regulatory protein